MRIAVWCRELRVTFRSGNKRTGPWSGRLHPWPDRQIIFQQFQTTRDKFQLYCYGNLTPEIGRYLFSVHSAAQHGISVVMNVNGLCCNVTVCLWQQAGEWRTHTPQTCVLWSQVFHRKLILQRLQNPFSFGMNVFSVKRSVICERCWKGWKSTCAWQKREASLMVVFWVKLFGILSLHGRFDHTSSTSWSMPLLMDQCQRSRCKVLSTMCVSMTITASIAGFSSSSQAMKFPSVNLRSWMNCRLLVTR